MRIPTSGGPSAILSETSGQHQHDAVYPLTKALYVFRIEPPFSGEEWLARLGYWPPPCRTRPILYLCVVKELYGRMKQTFLSAQMPRSD